MRKAVLFMFLLLLLFASGSRANEAKGMQPLKREVSAIVTPKTSHVWHGIEMSDDFTLESELNIRREIYENGYIIFGGYFDFDSGYPDEDGDDEWRLIETGWSAKYLPYVFQNEYRSFAPYIGYRYVHQKWRFSEVGDQDYQELLIGASWAGKFYGGTLSLWFGGTWNLDEDNRVDHEQYEVGAKYSYPTSYGRLNVKVALAHEKIEIENFVYNLTDNTWRDLDEDYDIFYGEISFQVYLRPNMGLKAVEPFAAFTAPLSDSDRDVVEDLSVSGDDVVGWVGVRFWF